TPAGGPVFQFRRENLCKIDKARLYSRIAGPDRDAQLDGGHALADPEIDLGVVAARILAGIRGIADPRHGLELFTRLLSLGIDYGERERVDLDEDAGKVARRPLADGLLARRDHVEDGGVRRERLGLGPA